MHQLTIDIFAAAKRAGKYRVLIVDNDPFVRDLHATALCRNGYIVDTTEDGIEALELLAGKPFDLVLMERSIPKFDAAAIVLALRSAGSQVPVVMMGELLRKNSLPAAVRQEVAAAIQKPSRITTVLLAVALSLAASATRINMRIYEVEHLAA